MVCVSLDINAINEAAYFINKISPKFVYVNIPESVEELLPAWDFETAYPEGQGFVFITYLISYFL